MQLVIYVVVFASGVVFGGILGIVQVRRARRLLNKAGAVHNMSVIMRGASQDQLLAAKKALDEAAALSKNYAEWAKSL